MGADVVFTEMVSINGLTRNNEKSFEMLPTKEENAVIQFFGKEPELFSRSAEMVRGLTKWVDVNSACPVPKIVKNGYGAALMKKPVLLRKIVESMASKDVKVSVKIRMGWNADLNFLEVAKAAEDGGAFLVTVHGRTVEQGYAGEAVWEPAGILKENLSIKVGVSGDIFTPETALKAWKQTGADMIFVARGAIGNPWIFRGIKEKFSGMQFIPPTLEETRDMIKKHLFSEIEEHGLHGIMIFRKFLSAYLRNLPDSHRAKVEMLRLGEHRLLIEAVDRYFDKLISCEQGGVEHGNT